MKKLCIVLFCTALFSQAGMAQNLNSLLKKVPDVQNIEIPSMDIALAQAEAIGATIELPSFINNIAKIELFDLFTCSEKLRLKITEEIQSKNTANHYETLSQFKNKEKFIKVLLKKEQTIIKEIVVFFSKSNSEKVIRIQGNIHENDLADLMNNYVQNN